MTARDVRRLRTRLGWSQERLARELGMSFSTISRWERGQGSPSPVAERQLESLMRRRTPPEAWRTADQIDLTPMIGLFEGPVDLSIRHDEYLADEDPR